MRPVLVLVPVQQQPLLALALVLALPSDSQQQVGLHQVAQRWTAMVQRQAWSTLVRARHRCHRQGRQPPVTVRVMHRWQLRHH